MSRLPRFGLPLLGKEMAELAVRKRTYQVRVVYAVILIIYCCSMLLYVFPASGTRSLQSLGLGWPLAVWLGHLQRIGLHVLLPILACGVFTSEKERNTLGLLFLTRLGPWTIVIEKFLSRMLLAASFLVISAPVLAFAYSLGGVTIEDLCTFFLSLLIIAAKVVSICLLCSAYCRTTWGALLASYLLIYLAGAAATFVALLSLSFSFDEPWWPQLRGLLTDQTFFACFADVPPWWFVGPTAMMSSPLGTSLGLRFLSFAVPTLVISMSCLGLARLFLVSRAFVPPSRRVKRLLEGIDHGFSRMNHNRLTRGIVLTGRDNSLPEDAPVAWRETHTRAIGQLRYMVRWLLVIELPLLHALCVIPEQALAKALLMVFWGILPAVALIVSAGLFNRERGQQTLDVLLATPISSRDIILQKLAGIQRWIWLCQLPMWTCLFFYWMSGRSPHQHNPTEFILNHASMLLIYPWMIAWIGVWCGLRSKTTIAAVMQSVFWCVVRCLVPLLIIGLYLQTLTLVAQESFWAAEMRKVATAATLFSPITLITLSELPRIGAGYDLLYPYGLPIGFLVNALIQGLFLYQIRKRCLDQADVLLGRTPAEFASKTVEAVTPDAELIPSYP